MRRAAARAALRVATLRGATLRAARIGVAATAAAVLGVALPGRAARAQEVTCDRGDVEVRGLAFEGNRAFSDDQLASVVVTTPSSSVYRNRVLRVTPLRWFGARRCIPRSEVVLDRARLILFYRNRGYPDVQVDTAVTADGDAIRVRFAVVEGRPVRVETVRVDWMDSVPGTARLVRGLPVREGAAFDKLAVRAAQDTLLARLGNAGYPWAQVLAAYETDNEAYQARVTLEVLPGTRTRLGRVEVVSSPRPGSRQQMGDGVVERLTGLREGAVYRDRDLAAARRNLYLTEAFQNVSIVRDSSLARTGADSLVNLRVLVTEGFMRAARVSAGYGTIDCFRGQGDLTHRNVQAFGFATRLEVTGRISKIGRGEPFGSRATGEALCPQITRGNNFDPYSSRLNYYTGVTLRQPVLAGVPNILPTVTLFSQRASEYKAFLRTVPIGGVATYTWSPRRTLPQVVSYALERGRTEAAPAVFCAAFNACVEEDREQLQRTLRSATLGWSMTRNRANDPVNPSRGSVARLDLRHASDLTGSDRQVQFSKAVGDVSWYLPFGPVGNVLALRVRGGGVFGNSFGSLGEFSRSIPRFVPQQERLFAGGAQTVRGFRQNELGPQVYVASLFEAVPVRDSAGDPVVEPGTGKAVFTLRAPVDAAGQLADTVSTRAVPTGGNTLVVTNLEYRFRSPFLADLVQWVAFVDAGNVWDRSVARQGGDALTLFTTPGFGVRVASPFGPIRVDFGHNPYELSSGAVFYEDVANESRPLYCVTPSNSIRVVNDGTAEVPRYRQLDPSARCPSTYQPSRRRGLRAWNVSLSIAQAF